MNYTRRTWLTAAGAVGFSAALTRCGGGDPLASATTDAASAPLADAARSRRTPPTVVSGTTGRVVVVGGGMAGLAAAKYLKVWGGSGVQVTLVERNPSYTSNILSNLVLTGQRTVSSLVYSYSTVKQNYGVDIRQGTVVGIDPVGKKVTLADGSTLQYDRLIVAPGVVFDVLPGLESDAARSRVVHAWQAGPETTTLRNQLVAMPAGGTFVMTIPASPYRCPPGPYERACVVADWLKRNKPGSKVIVLDANAGIQAERHTFETAFAGLFAGIVEYVPNAAVNVDRHRASRGSPSIRLNGRPSSATSSTRSRRSAQARSSATTGLPMPSAAWAGVKAATFESTAAAGVHVIGDSCSAGIPKAGHIGNQEGKTAADAILRAFRGLAPDTDVVVNSACYSPITASTASWLTALYQYDASRPQRLQDRRRRNVGGGQPDIRQLQRDEQVVRHADGRDVRLSVEALEDRGRRILGALAHHHLADRGRDQHTVLVARFALGRDDAAAPRRLRRESDDRPRDPQRVAGAHRREEARVVLEIADRGAGGEIAERGAHQRGRDHPVQDAAAEPRASGEVGVDVQRVEVADQARPVGEVAVGDLNVVAEASRPRANCENRRPAYGARGRGTIKRSLTRNGGGAAPAWLRAVARLGLGRLEDLGTVVGAGVDQFGDEGVRDLEIATAIGAVGDFAPALLRQPYPQRVGHSGLHDHAVIHRA